MKKLGSQAGDTTNEKFKLFSLYPASFETRERFVWKETLPLNVLGSDIPVRFILHLELFFFFKVSDPQQTFVEYFFIN